jgi:hypothetical protein
VLKYKEICKLAIGSTLSSNFGTYGKPIMTSKEENMKILHKQ